MTRPERREHVEHPVEPTAASSATVEAVDVLLNDGSVPVPDRVGVAGYVDFAVSVSAVDGVTVVHVSGDLDCFSAPRLRAALTELVDDVPRQVILDVADTHFIDSTGLGVLVGGAKRVRQSGGDLVLRSPSASTRRLLEITGVTRLFEIV